MVENDRQRLLAVERLILETTCFNFTARIPFPYVIKLGKELRGMYCYWLIVVNEILTLLASKKLVKLAWRVSIDR